MQDFDQKLLREFRSQVRDTGTATFHDPKFPYSMTVEPSKRGHLIRIQDTRKRWWGREVMKYEHPLDDHVEIADNGPATVGLNILSRAIEGKIWPL
jgi:hypothetical protein